MPNITLSLEAAVERAQALGTTIRDNRARLAQMVMQDGYDPQDGRALYEQIERDAQVYAQLRSYIEDQQGSAARRLESRMPRTGGGLDRDAMGGLYRALLVGGAPSTQVRDALSLPTVAESNATGAYLLPKTISDQLIRDIVEDDSVLAEITTTSVPGLEQPKVSTTDVDGDDVDDGVEAPDAATSAELIVFGRHPYAKSVPVPNSLLADTNTAIEAYINTRHQEMMRARICKRIFDAAAAGKYTHMSVYHADNAVKDVTGADLLEAIMAALADLPTRPAGSYKVAMTMSHWVSLIKTLSNGATALFSAPSREVLGFEPVISNYASKVLVGNLKTIHLNFDSAITYEPERRAKARKTDFVLSTYYDVQIEQPELLRTATVSGG